MKFKQKIVITFLTISFIINSVSISASATTVSNTEKQINGNGFTIEELTPIDLSDVEPSNIIELPQLEAAVLSEGSEPSPELSPDLNAPEINLSDLEKAKSLDDSLTEEQNKSRAGSSYELVTVSDVLQPGASDVAYTISVGNGQILQVELQVPRSLSLNYDLYLFKVDNATGQLTLVSGSEYATDSIYMPESAGAVNTSGGTLTYAIWIDSKGNPSTTDYFTINASVGNDYDLLEPNESAFFALPFPNMTTTTAITVSGGLNTPIDNDWFSLYIENISSFAGVEITNIPSSVIVESYKVSNGNQMTKTGSTLGGAVLPIVSGYNYFRIISNRKGAFSPENYKIMFSPALTATKMITYVAVDGYCQRTSNLFADGLTRYLFVLASQVEVKTLYVTSNNILAKASDTVDVEIYNPAWDSAFMQYERGTGTVKDGSSCSTFLKGPTLRGNKLDYVYTTIKSKRFGTVANNVQMALLNKYDDGELNRPCRHNGTCGFR